MSLFPNALLLKARSELVAAEAAQIWLEMKNLRPVSDQLNQNMADLHIKGWKALL